MQLTSMKFRLDLATSLQRTLAAAGERAAASPARIPVDRARISQSAAPLARLADCLAAPGPLPAQGVAMVSLLLADGTGPLYREACGDDLGDIIENVTRALTR